MRPNHIYIVTHKAELFPSASVFRPIQSGRALNPLIDGIIGDDTGDNISHLNPYFAEIAPMYWVWRNTSKCDYVGFFHYRRFLNFREPLAPGAHWLRRNFHDFDEANCERFGWTNACVAEAMGDCDIAVAEVEHATLPPSWQEPCTLYEHYRNAHTPRDINLALKILSEVHPADAALAERVMNSRTGYFCHIYVMRWNLFDRYMSWLFAIFNAMMPRMDLTSPTYAIETGQQRVFGFIGERLFNVFIERSRLEGARIREFERLFGLIEGSAGVAAPPLAQKRNKIVHKMQNGVTLRALGREISVYVPD